MDKEGILSLPNPCAEKVFFLKSRKHKLKEELAGKAKVRKESTCTWTSETSRQSSSQDGQESSDDEDDDDDDDDDDNIGDGDGDGGGDIGDNDFESASKCIDRRLMNFSFLF